METALIAKVNIFINAPVEAVWKALTDPEMIKAYFFGTTVSTDWKKESPIIFSGEWEGKYYEDKGTIEEMVPNKILRYTYWSNLSGTEDKPENYANVTYETKADGSGTRLIVTQDNIADEEKREHSEKSWQSILESMKKLVEK